MQGLYLFFAPLLKMAPGKDIESQRGGNGINNSRKQDYGTYQPVNSNTSGSNEPSFASRKRTNFKCLSWLLGLLLFVPVAYFFLFYIPTSKPKFIPVDDVHVVKSLDFEPSNVNNSKLIVIGDVHGMYDQLESLLDKVDYQQHRDQVVFLGDFISKGPKSFEVLDFAMTHDVKCVRGNHEDELLYLYTSRYNLPKPAVKGHQSSLREYDDFEDLDDASDREIVMNLKPRHINYLSTCSVMLDMGKVAPGGYRAVGCHGGLMWNVDTLKDQDPDAVMYVRTLHGKKHDKPDENKTGIPWSEVYNEKMPERDPKKRWVVYYGHNASKGLTMKNYTRGHDSGCVKGKKLSASVITQNEDGKFDNEIVSVSCDN